MLHDSSYINSLHSVAVPFPSLRRLKISVFALQQTTWLPSKVNQIKHRLRLDTLPNLINSLRRSVTNRTLINTAESLFQLLQRIRANDYGISILRLERTVILHPAIRQIRFRRALLFRHRGPLLQRFKEAALVEAFVVSVAVRGGWVEAAFPGGDVGGRFSEEAAGEGGVGVEALYFWVSISLGRRIRWRRSDGLTMSSFRSNGSSSSSCFRAIAE